MTKLELIELIVIAIVILFLAIYYGIKAIRNGWIDKITATINEAIKYAEKNIEGGAAKKAYVMQQVEDKCYELGIPYALVKKLVDKLINKIIANYNILSK